MGTTEHMERARENLRVAGWAIGEATPVAPNAGTSRAYFAAFHAAIAALLTTQGYEVPDRWSHGAVASDFSVQCIQRRKLVPRKYRGTLAKLMGHRHAADYDGGGVSGKVAVHCEKEAEAFVIVVHELCLGLVG